MDISAALRARIGSLLIGSKGRMLNTSVSIDMAELQKRNVVIEMAEMGSDDEKCLIMALLIISLYENAGEVSVDGKKPLKHILVIEEAHRLLRNAASSDNPEIANIRGSAVEHFSNM
ncbi:MAG TPA: ATP-binding protein, partial [bacterium]|nr:ATP-binding protein [bacterium]